jgi:hypothetical protein
MNAYGRVVQDQARLLRARTDVDYLCDLIGVRRLPPHARALYELVKANQGPDDKLLLLTAPGCLKSTVIALAMLQDLLGPDPHILFASKSDKVVKRTGAFLRASISKIYGPETIKPQSRQIGWKESDEIFCVPGWQPSTRDASWVGATLGVDIEGIRANRCYLDDVIDRESTTSEAYREAALEWYTLTLVDRLDKGAPQTAVGSLWHEDDLHMVFMARGWPAHLFPFARRARPEGFDKYPNAVWHGEEYDILWPENFAGVDLPTFILDHGGEIAYQLRFQLNPWVLKDTRFKAHWFAYYQTPLAPFERGRLRIHMAVDPALGKSDVGSEASITVLGLDETTHLEYVLENIAGHWNPVERNQHIKAAYERWHPRKIYVEAVGMQEEIVTELRHQYDLPAFGLSTEGKDKIARIDTLCVPVERGQIIFHLSQQDLVHQLLNFPKGRLLDRADSLEIAHRSFRAGEGRLVRTPRAGNFGRGTRDAPDPFGPFGGL